MSQNDTRSKASDEALIANARSGDQHAFAELWRRHYRSGVRVARQFTSSLDADDLVSEAYVRIYQRVLAGGGPTGPFRPYLYTTIRNLASTWGAKSKDVQVDDIADFEDPDTIEDPAAVALDRTLTAKAFRTLPERWQSVLWYTEVEGMDPHEVAPLLGMTANGVAALSYRAREGLRKAWLQAHVSNAVAGGECQWAIQRLGDHARHSLTQRENDRLELHLVGCASCSIISEEVDEVGSRLALVLVPMLLGGVAGGALLASLGHASTATAATAASFVIPAAPASFAVVAGAGSAAPAVSMGLTLGAATGASALVGSVAIAAVVGGGVALGITTQHPLPAPKHQVVAAAAAVTPQPALSEVPWKVPIARVPLSDPTNIDGILEHQQGSQSGLSSTLGTTVDTLGTTVNGVVSGVTDNVVAPVIKAVTPGAPPAGHEAPGGAPVTAVVKLGGTGTPGAVVSAQAAGVVYGTAKVGQDGKFSLLISALPAGTDTLQLGQTLSLLGINLPITVPLSLDTGPLGVVVKILN